MSAATPLAFPATAADLHPSPVIEIPAPRAAKVDIRYASLPDRDRFAPLTWSKQTLQPIASRLGRFQIDIDALNLSDGVYEYEFVVDDYANAPIPDPYADEIVRFGGYRSVFRIRAGRRVTQPFSWADELPAGVRLPNNHELVIYELPLRWISGERDRQVGLGTFDKAIFEHLNDLSDLGVNAIELLPAQDSTDTLNWGYGTRFFFAPDLDMGSPVDAKFFIKCCHQRGIRVLLDVVMNHSKACPLERLAFDEYYLRHPADEGERPEWGGKVFRFATPLNGKFAARDFLCRMGEFWVREYHVDGFRIDEFKGINNWDFVQQFRERVWAEHKRLLSSRPFLVVAEDSWGRAEITKDRAPNPNGRRVVDAIWNFSYHFETRRLLTNDITTEWSQPARRDRIQASVSGQRLWDGLQSGYREGFADMSQAVNYFTSHDVEQSERLTNLLLARLLRERGLGDGSVENVRRVVDELATQPAPVQGAHAEALDRVGSAFALLLTSVGIPMFLAGEEHGDVHDLPYGDWRLKMSDPVDWYRAQQPAHAALRQRVRDLIRLRTSHPALQRNEVDFFYFHPTIDEKVGVRVFAYCRTAGRPLGSPGQVVVLTNCGPDSFPAFEFPWPWGTDGLQERGTPASGTAAQPLVSSARLRVSLAPFQVRVLVM